MSMMLKSRSVLLKLIRGMIHESPIVGDKPFTPVEREDERHPVKGHSVGYKSASLHRPAAQEYFKQTKDNWDIIPVSDVDDIHNYVNSQEFLEEIERRNYPSGTKILVISSMPMKGDLDTPEWVVKHDIIGHTIAEFPFRGEFTEVDVANVISSYIRDREGSEAGTRAWYAGTRPPHITDGIHKMLPSDLRRGGPDDVVSDIYAGIFFGEIDQGWLTTVVYDFLKQKFSNVDIKLIKDLSTRHVASLFGSVSAWKSSMKPGINVIELWGL